MMFPSAVQGHMPFVDKYKQEQIRKVVAKHRSRHHSGPDSRSRAHDSVKHKNTHSMPILWQSVYTGQRPKFISMPTLDEQHMARLQVQSKEEKSNKSFLSSLRKLFGSKKEDSNSNSASPVKHSRTTGAVVHGNYAHSFSSTSSCSKKPATADTDFVITGVRSPKRQRMRTISNKSGVMETIEEVNEIMASADHITDISDNSSNSEGDSLRRIASSPDASNLFYSCGNLSNHTDSSSSQTGSSELICAA